MISLVFWDYNLLHLNRPLFIIDDFYNLDMTFKEFITRYRYNFIADNLATIHFLKVYKNKPKEFMDINNPYWNQNTKIIDYINFYQIKNKKCDIIFIITR